MESFNIVCCGGTFDHFHKGHREFLKTCISYGEKIILGITSDEYVQNSKFSPSTSLRTSPSAKLRARIQNSKLIESHEIRRKSLINFLKEEDSLKRTKIVSINDLFGPTKSKDFICNALVVSEVSTNSAEIINKEREKMGLLPLKIIVQKLIPADDGKPISSFRIRNGEINREGRLNINPIWLNKDLAITSSLREILQKPLGRLFGKITKKPENVFYTAAVGDFTVRLFNKLSFGQNISVVDLKIEREKRFKSIKDLGFLEKKTVLKVENPAGFLTSELFKTVVKAIDLVNSKKIVVIKIEGEEDLSVLPLILALPLGSLVFYGQRKQGITEVEVSERQKEKIYNLVSQFKAKI